MIKLVEFAEYQDDILAMMLDMQHLEPQPLDIDAQRYIDLQAAGYLLVFLWLDGDAIKGVALLFVIPSMRNAALTDVATDVLWVKPRHRGNSSVFMDGIRKFLARMGYNYWLVSSRDSHPITGFLHKNGFKPLEHVYYREVTDGVC